MSFTIRSAEEADVPHIIDMGERFFSASKWSSSIATFDRESFKATVQRMMTPPDVGGGLILYAESKGRPAGMVGVVCFPCYFNLNIIFAQELFLWAEPEHRGHLGPQLLDAIELICGDLGVQVMICGSISGLKDKLVGELYARRGYRPSESSFIKAL